MVFGNERNYCVALVTLDPDAMPGWAEENGQGQVVRRAGRVRRGRHMVQGYVDQLNSELNRWETIKSSGCSTTTSPSSRAS